MPHLEKKKIYIQYNVCIRKLKREKQTLSTETRYLAIPFISEGMGKLETRVLGKLVCKNCPHNTGIMLVAYELR